jgi:hypothetical protein
MRRISVYLVGLSLGVSLAGCKTPEVLSGWNSYVPGFGTTATEEELPSPGATVESEMPPVEGDWDAP